jgi:hypothetical protein
LLGRIETKGHLAQYQRSLVERRIGELDIALGIGMRKGEQHGPQWKDVDLAEGPISLHHAKNGRTRAVCMIDDVVDAFQKFRELGLNRCEGTKLGGSPKQASHARAISEGTRHC